MEVSAVYPSDMADLTITGEISKVDEDKRQVFGWASVTEIDGEPVVDLQNDTLDTYELEKAAYDYVLHSRVGGAMHERVGKSSPKQVGTLIESFVVTPEKVSKMGLPPETPNGWWIGFQIGEDDDVWKKVKKGEFTGFSIHGVGKRTPIEKNVMTRTRAEYDGWLKRMAHIVDTDPDSIDLHLKQWMESEGKTNPSDDDVHNFLMTAYSDGDPHGEVTKTIAKHLVETHDRMSKHLIGRHDQKDHDPTKGGTKESHIRDEHAGFLRRFSPEKSQKMARAENTTGDFFVDAMEQGDFESQDELLADYEKWSTKKFDEPLYGNAETVEYMVDRGFWDPKDFQERSRSLLRGSRGKLVDELEEAERESRGIVPVSRERRRELAEEADELMEKQLSRSDQRKLFLLAKIAERSKSEDEAATYAETVSKALGEAGQEELSSYFSAVHKHLIGRHAQKDHDPTKKGKGKGRHSRKDHIKASGLSEKDYKRRRNLGWLAGGMGAAAATGQGLFRQNRPLGEAYAGHMARGTAFTPGIPYFGPLVGAGLTHNIGFTPGQQRGRKRRGLSKAFSEREREVLSKYLGKDFL